MPARAPYQAALTLQQRVACIAEAESRWDIHKHADGSWMELPKGAPLGPVHFASVKQHKHLSHVGDWARERAIEGWMAFEADPRAIRLHGQRPLQSRCRLPPWWLDERFGESSPAHGLRTGTKLPLLQKFPDLETVLRRWHELHEAERSEDKKVSFHDTLFSFNAELRRTREGFEQAGMHGRLPEKVSVGWFAGQKRRLGILNSAVQSTEVRRPERAAIEQFWASCARTQEEHGIARDLVLIFDEVPDYYMAVPKRVQSTAKERSKATGRRCKRTSRGRVSFTACLSFSPAERGRVLLLVKSCRPPMLKAIQEDFGGHVEVVARRGSVMTGTTHARVVLEKMIGPLADHIRHARGLPPQSKILYTEDPAPAHTGDKCKASGEGDLQRKRREALAKFNLVRELLPENSTPDLCEVDQIAKIVKQEKNNVLHEILGDGPDIRLRPSRSPNAAAHMAPGGPLVTDCGSMRSPTLYHIAGAWAAAWASVSQLTLCAAFVRCGWLTEGQAAGVLREHPSAVLAGVNDLRRRQQALRKQNVWLHADQDFSGGPAAEAPDAPAPSAEELAVLRRNQQELARIRGKLLDSILAQLAGGAEDADGARLSRALDVSRATPFESTLANIAELPTQDNVGESKYFLAAVPVALKKSKLFTKEKRRALVNDVLDWHFLQLERTYVRLLEAKDPRVWRVAAGRAQQTTLSAWLWSILASAAKKDQTGADDVWRRMVGDFKKASLNPGSLHRTKKAPSAKGAGKGEAGAGGAAPAAAPPSGAGGLHRIKRVSAAAVAGKIGAGSGAAASAAAAPSGAAPSVQGPPQGADPAAAAASGAAPPAPGGAARVCAGLVALLASEAAAATGAAAAAAPH
ncbi:unnamed protein product [Prorocentrum cordatum]|uniref:Uncharacterized protein n=1 Tax=Prorocentrum cordatum TaxID=2364126 RepID=A0ABN9XTH2_9DINO|nr:unnamed protein product [Polarella glacialis]